MAQKNISDLVKDPSWQKIRASLVGQWKEKPQWACSQLKSYLGSLSSTTNDKLKIIMNYLTGTAFRIGRINHPCVKGLRTQISSEIKKRKSKGEW
jgi:hypothetical protein